MSNSFWKTTADLPQKNWVWPSVGQIIIQLAIVSIVTLLWGGLFWGFLSFTGNQPATQPTASGVAEVEITATTTPTPAPTNTPQPTNTTTVTPSELPATSESTATDNNVQPTITPSPEPTATQTPLPPTDTPQPEPDSQASDTVSYANDVFPILERRCIQCHGGVQDDGSVRVEEGLDMTTYDGLITGSWNGTVLEPGNAEDSYLVEQIVSGEMPKKGPRLLPGEVRVIRQWIDGGALNN